MQSRSREADAENRGVDTVERGMGWPEREAVTCIHDVCKPES